jgi:hypothetical protein
MKFAWLGLLLAATVGCGQPEEAEQAASPEGNEGGAGGGQAPDNAQGGNSGEAVGTGESTSTGGGTAAKDTGVAVAGDGGVTAGDGGLAPTFVDEPPVPGAKPMFFGGGGSARYGNSVDGKAWKQGGSGNGGEASDLVRGVGYGDGVFIGVGGAFGSGYVVRTTDGVNFSFPRSNTGWLGDVAFDHGLWVAAGGNGVRARSADGGKTWTSAGSDFQGHFRRIAAGGGRFLAVGHQGSGNGMSSVSLDGIKWSPSRIGGGSEWRGVAFGNGVFVLASGSSCQVTADGLAFTDCGVPGSDRGVFFLGGEFVLFRPGRFDHSPDGKNWTKGTAGGVPGGAEDRGIAYGSRLNIGMGGGRLFLGPMLEKLANTGGPNFGDLTFGWVMP